MAQLINAELVDNLKPFFPTRREWHERASTVEGSTITSIVAGAGLGGGGSSGAVNLFVNTGDGIEIVADAVAVDLATTSGLSFATGELQLDDSVAGNGLTIASKVLAVGAGDGLDIAADTLTVDVTDIIDTNFGLTESTNDIRINLASPSGLSFAAGALQIDDSIAGSGLIIASKVLSVDAGSIDHSGLPGDGLVWDAVGSEIDLGTPSTLTVATSNAVTASSHTHAITSSSNPGAAASLLASDASGHLQLVRIGAGVSPSYPIHAQASGSPAMVLTDGTRTADFEVDANGLNITPSTGRTLFPGGVGVGGYYPASSAMIGIRGTSNQLRIEYDDGVSYPNAIFNVNSAGTMYVTTSGLTRLTPSSNLYLEPSGGIVRTTGKLSVGDSGFIPTQSFEVRSTTSPQVRIGYDGTNFANFSVASDGDLTIAPSGTSGDLYFAPGGNTTFLTDSALVITRTTVPQLRLIHTSGNQLDVDIEADGQAVFNNAGTDAGITLAPGNSSVDITGVLTINPASATAPIILGANGQSQLVSGLRADELAKDVIAGTGLSGGGTLTSNVTLNIDLASGDFDALAGDGLTWDAVSDEIDLGTPSTLTVSTSNAVTASSHTHAITSSSNPGAAASLLASDASGHLQLVRLGVGVSPSYKLHVSGTDPRLYLEDGAHWASLLLDNTGGNLDLSASRQIRINSTPGVRINTGINGPVNIDGNSVGFAPTGAVTINGNSVTIAPVGGDITLNPSGKDVLPNTNYDINLGSATQRYLTLHAAELRVETLVAQDTLATVGGRVLVGPTTILEEDITSTVISGAEELTNPGLETWSSETALTGWSQSGNIIRNGDSHGGTWAARVSSTSTGRSLMSQAVGYTNGKYYELSFWVRREKDQIGYPQYAIYDSGNATFLVPKTDITSPVGVWTKITNGFRAEVGHIQIDLRFYSPPPNDRNRQAAYIEGKYGYEEDSRSVYVLGDTDNTSNLSAYIDGEEPFDSVSAFIEANELYGVLYDDISVVEKNAVIVKHNEMAVGDIAYMEAGGSIEFVEVKSDPIDNAGNYAYVVERNLDGSGANAWETGTAIFNTGGSGDGFIDLYSVSGVASVGLGPTIVGNIRNSATFNDFNEHWAIGRLDGLYGQSGGVYGVGLGRYASGYRHVLITDSGGIEFWDGDEATGELIGSWDGTTVQSGPASSDHLLLSSSGIQLKSGSIVRGEWQSDGDIFIGSNTGDPTTTYFSVFSTGQTYNFETMTAGDLLIGDNSGLSVEIENPGFELWIPPYYDKLVGWLDDVSYVGGGVIKEQIFPHSGTYAVKLLNDGFGQPYIGQNVSVESSTYYVLTGWHNGTGRYAIYDVTNSTWLVSETDAPPSSTFFSWNYFEQAFTTASNTAVIRIYLYAPTTGSASGIFDDISLYKDFELNILFDKGGNRLKIRRGLQEIVGFERDGKLTYGQHTGSDIVRLARRGIEINSAAPGVTSSRASLWITDDEWSKDVLQVLGYFDSTAEDLSYVLFDHSDDAVTKSSIEMRYDAAVSPSHTITIDALGSSGLIDLNGWLNVVDPIVCNALIDSFLISVTGIRWIGGNHNLNLLHNQFLEDISTTGMSSNNSKRDTTRWFHYTVVDDATPSYLFTNAAPNWYFTDTGTWAENPGITAGIWVYFDHLGTSDNMGIMGAWNANTTSASWRIHTWYAGTTTNMLNFSVSGTGSYDSSQEVDINLAPPTGRWVFVVARWDSGSELKLWMFDGDSTYTGTNTTSIISSLATSVHFYIGAYVNSSGTALAMDGRVSKSFFAGSALTDGEVQKMYDLSRHIYGV